MQFQTFAYLTFLDKRLLLGGASWSDCGTYLLFCRGKIVTMVKVSALDMILTGRPVGADEALQFGLVNRVVPDGQGECLRYDPHW